MIASLKLKKTYFRFIFWAKNWPLWQYLQESNLMFIWTPPANEMKRLVIQVHNETSLLLKTFSLQINNNNYEQMIFYEVFTK